LLVCVKIEDNDMVLLVTLCAMPSEFQGVSATRNTKEFFRVQGIVLKDWF